VQRAMIPRGIMQHASQQASQNRALTLPAKTSSPPISTWTC
jgi:hypothetical protein